jgi:hypothetical protein
MVLFHNKQCTSSTSSTIVVGFYEEEEELMLGLLATSCIKLASYSRWFLLAV